MENNFDYGRIGASQTIEYAPLVLSKDGNIILNPTINDYLCAGWKIVISSAPTVSPPSGYHWEATGKYKEGARTLQQTWRIVRNSARIFSKLKIEDELFKRGLLDALDAFIDAQTIPNEHGQTMPLRRKYETANDFSEDHPAFKAFYAKCKEVLEISDEDAEAILELSIAE